MYHGPQIAPAMTKKASRPRQERQPPRASATSTGPATNSTAVCLVMIARPVARPASAETPVRSKRREASTPQTLSATIAASGGSSMKTWKSETIIGVPSANTAASRPASGVPKASLPTP